MNLQQLEYIIAVDDHRHFVNAAEACFVTQATLSMMIRKLEDELGVVIFDRNMKPVVPTPVGKLIIAGARKIIKEASLILDIAHTEKNILKGDLRIGIIPTLAPYLLPLFLKNFINTFPDVKLSIHELTTSHCIDALKQHKIDAAILATPLHIDSLREHVLFYEKYHLYVNGKDTQYNKNFVLAKNLNLNELLLLEEGHCMRNQVLNFCEIKKSQSITSAVDYKAGSIETLLNLVDRHMGITIVPELATLHFSKSRKEQLRSFKQPVPVREISMVTFKDPIKTNLIHLLAEHIKKSVPEEMLSKGRTLVLDI